MSCYILIIVLNYCQGHDHNMFLGECPLSIALSFLFAPLLGHFPNLASQNLENTKQQHLSILVSEPTKVFNNKKYGRTTQPGDFGSFDDGIHSDGDLPNKKDSKETPKTHRPVVRRSSSRVNMN